VKTQRSLENRKKQQRVGHEVITNVPGKRQENGNFRLLAVGAFVNIRRIFTFVKIVI
jgi:hypothetical protein